MGAISTRLATAEDAHEATLVLRRSITELCVADHQHDAPTLERWLRNKTPENFENWRADPDNWTVLAELAGAIAGVAMLHRSGEVRLCYVRPDCVRMGVGRALLQTLEAQARHWQIATLKLNSSLTARHFYERCGFLLAGDPVPYYGVLGGYPFVRSLSPRRDMGEEHAPEARNGE